MPAIYTAGVTDAPALNSSTELKLQIFFNIQSEVYIYLSLFFFVSQMLYVQWCVRAVNGSIIR